jgi:hypothetical protein
VGSGENPIILDDDESESIADIDIDMHDDYDDDSPYEDPCGHSRLYNSRSADMRSDTNSHLSAPPPIQTREKDVSTSTPTPRNITHDDGAQTDLVSLHTEDLYSELTHSTPRSIVIFADIL